MLLPEVFLYAYAAREWVREQERRRLGQRPTDVGSGEIMVGEWTPEDVPGLLAMYRSIGAPRRRNGLPPLGEERLVAWVDEVLRRGPNVVARVGRRIVGHAALGPDTGSVLPLVFVHRDHEGTQLEPALVRALLTLARTSGSGHVQEARPATAWTWTAAVRSARQLVRGWRLAKARATGSTI